MIHATHEVSADNVTEFRIWSDDKLRHC